MKRSNRVRDVRTINTLLTGAEVEARRTGETLPGAEHLLLSALALPDGSARRTFERVGADPDGLRSAIEGQHAAALRAIGIEPPDDSELGSDLPAPTRAFRSNASARSVFQNASKMARSDHSSPLIGAHVVLAIADMEHGTAARALTAMGIDRTALAAAAREEIGRQAPLAADA